MNHHIKEFFIFVLAATLGGFAERRDGPYFSGNNGGQGTFVGNGGGGGNFGSGGGNFGSGGGNFGSGGGNFGSGGGNFGSGGGNYVTDGGIIVSGGNDGSGGGGSLESTIPGIPGQDYPVLQDVPSTGFTCDGQLPGYYADTDPEARCQVFHICEQGNRMHSLLCPLGTIFNQQYFVCDWWHNVICSTSEQFYNLNSLIGQTNSGNPTISGNFGGDFGSTVDGSGNYVSNTGSGGNVIGNSGIVGNFGNSGTGGNFGHSFQNPSGGYQVQGR